MSILINHKPRVRILLATVAILMVPLIAMQFTDEVNWNLFDFVVAAGLLIGSGLTFDVISRKSGSTAYQIGVGIAVLTALVLVWMNLAVGLIGSEDHPANLMYFVVLMVGFLGAASARFQPSGMSRALFAMAIAQASVPLIALIIWRPLQTLEMGAVCALNTVFALLFAGAALLIRSASRDRDAQEIQSA